MQPRACCATVSHAPIDLPEPVLVMIVSRVRDVMPATAKAVERSLCATMMRGIGSASKLWRHLAKGVLMRDELAWLTVPGAAAAAECISSFPRALSLRVVGGARGGDIAAVLGSRLVIRLALAKNNVMHDCDGLSQLVGLRLCTSQSVESCVMRWRCWRWLACAHRASHGVPSGRRRVHRVSRR